ncbi:MAG TPA: ThuA domain-containing protein, partial [Ilumatobacteraceae bacterium]|nr:ThuA domain-containing protein [Ilumatobacteraceae bacterium]
MRRTTFAVLAALAALCTVLFTASVAGAQAPAATIDAEGTEWAPDVATVTTGETVRWTFAGETLPHNVRSTSANWSVNTPQATGQAAFDYTFTQAGVYTFVCDVHAGTMTGTITVEDAGADPLENVLVYFEAAGFPHTSRDEGVAAIEALGTANDFNVDASEDSAVFTAANLAQYDAVVFLSTTGDALTDEQQEAFEDYYRGGGGYVGIHSATDTEYGWAWYGDMLGGYFRSHPPGTPTATVNIEDGNEPSTEGLPTNWVRTDEWYNFQSAVDPVVNGGGDDVSPRAHGVKVLATVDESTYDEQDGNATNDDHPVAWCSDFDGGRMWYTALGHTEESFGTGAGNIRSHILGGLQTVTGAEPADCGEPRAALPQDDDFELVTIDDDTESPMELTVADDGRVFYVERVTGEINVYNPVNGQVTTAITLPVSSVLENGGIGIVLAPDFNTSNHIYVAYTPLPATNNQGRVSRFTVGANNVIAPGSEQFIFQWTAQRETCCHSGGSLAFGADGNLYISTGDNTNPFESDGMAPIDERPGRQNFDAQRTSANSNNHNGKVLRIRPVPNATGAPGIGTTYTIPSGNMFAPGTPQTLPEIYAMGFRNPFRITVDPHTGWVLVGNYGPDAAQTVGNRGPQGSVEFEVVKQPGFYGWPYCVRDNVPYNDYNFANGQSGPKFNCADLTNDSPNNTGIQDLPPAIPAAMWLGYSETDPRVPGLGSGGAPTGGPRYEFDPDLDSPTKFPEYYDKSWFIGEWNNGWLRTATLDDQGNATGVFQTPWEDTFFRPHEIEFGPDGALYVIDWGTGFNGNNANSGIYRIDYVAGAKRPIAHATSNVDNGPT